MKLSKTLATFIGLIVFALGSVSAVAGPPDHANGKPPEKFYWIDVFGGPTTFTDGFIECDGFSTLITITLQGFWMTHAATPGKDGWEFYHSAYPTTIANENDPSIFVEGIPGQHINRHWVAEPFASDPIETGVQMMITLPRYGVIYRDVGRLRIDWDTGDPVFVAGEWDSLDDDYQALCEALTP